MYHILEVEIHIILLCLNKINLASTNGENSSKDDGTPPPTPTIMKTKKKRDMRFKYIVECIAD